jgi:hypothetical protein
MIIDNLDGRLYALIVVADLFLNLLLELFLHLISKVIFPAHKLHTFGLFPNLVKGAELGVWSHPVGFLVYLVNDNLANRDNYISEWNVGNYDINSDIRDCSNYLVLVLYDLVPDFVGNLAPNMNCGVFHFAADFAADIYHFVFDMVENIGFGCGS